MNKKPEYVFPGQKLPNHSFSTWDFSCFSKCLCTRQKHFPECLAFRHTKTKKLMSSFSVVRRLDPSVSEWDLFYFFACLSP